jgi:hypothetical protein
MGNYRNCKLVCLKKWHNRYVSKPTGTNWYPGWGPLTQDMWQKTIMLINYRGLPIGKCEEPKRKEKK